MLNATPTTQRRQHNPYHRGTVDLLPAAVARVIPQHNTNSAMTAAVVTVSLPHAQLAGRAAISATAAVSQQSTTLANINAAQLPTEQIADYSRISNNPDLFRDGRHNSCFDLAGYSTNTYAQPLSLRDLFALAISKLQFLSIDGLRVMSEILLA